MVFLGGILALSGHAASQESRFFGLPHTALGEARLEPTPDGLLISGIGTSGQDGVAVGLGEAGFHIVRFDPGSAASLPDGAFTEFSVRGVVDGARDAPIWSLRATDIGDRFGLSFDTTAVRPRQLRIEARRGGRLMLQQTIPVPGPTDIIARFRPEGCWVDPIWPMGPENWALIGFPSPAPVEFPSGPIVLADQIILVSLDQQATIGTISTTELRGRSIPRLLILDEALGQFGFEHRSRGQAQLLAERGALRIGGIGSSGQDGVHISWFESIGASSGFAAEIAPVQLPLPTTRLTLQATGIVDGIPGASLGESSIGNGVLTADFRTIGAQQTRLIGLRDGVIIAELLLPAGGTIATLDTGIVIDGCGKWPPRPPFPFPPFPCFIWTFPDVFTITPISGAAFRADELRVLAVDALAPITGIDSFSILGQGIDQITMLSASFIAGCLADCDGDGVLDIFDFLCFQNQFAAGDLRADCDGSGQLDIFDFLCFQDAFAAGCR